MTPHKNIVAVSPEELACSPTVLIIDDDVRIDDPLVAMLRLEGLVVACSQSGNDGLSSAAAILPDAVVLDLHLPDVPGLSVLRQLRRNGILCPIVAVTGWYMDDRFELAARKDGANAFRRKPFDGSELALVLKTAIDNGVGFGGIRDREQSSLSTNPPFSNDNSKESSAPWQLQDEVAGGGDVAFERLVCELLPLLHRRVRRRFPHIADDVISDAVEDAMLEYGRRPSRFDPARGVPLIGYLALASSRNVINRLDSERRRVLRETQYATCCLPIHRPADASVHIRLSPFEQLRVLSKIALTPRERLTVRQWLAGERHTRVLAKALGFDELPPREQEREVKRFKGRIMKRLSRLQDGDQ